MLRSEGQQGQVSMRQALTVATTGTHDYMQRCCVKMRSELLSTTVKFTVEILSSTFVWLDLCTEVIRGTKNRLTEVSLLKHKTHYHLYPQF